MAKRKQLIGLNALIEGNRLLDMGVPLTRIHEDLGFTWTYQSTADIFRADRENKHDVTRPPWLASEPALQEAPADWKFVGVFPHGTWELK